ncbi:hypothetical protein EPA93_20115 [Ktedonosporobacter rubrisoli]|uniref:DUF3159 domain-containing protein n=1 Tax=Ktedonosporobacter rubrisoli TaxID=2509675 RepID=A0A4P6JRR4_KTERU|nr:VC0807 family protein [Ktedonosporobacter rubrisoli]QBD78177.1 hypothetical protein EPA93_20115 [Ktedonosporobacter rubrisoli]
MQKQTSVLANSEKQPTIDKKIILRNLAITLAVNAAGPYIIYMVLENYLHVPTLLALVATAVPSVIDSVVGIIRQKRINIIAGFTLVTVLIGLLLLFISGDQRLYLVRDACFTAVFGLVFLISSFFKRPLMFYLARTFVSGNTQEGIARFDLRWQQSAELRANMRTISLIWGAGLFLEAMLRISLVFTLSTQQFLSLSPFVSYGVVALLLALTMYISRRARNRSKESSNA